MSLRGWASPPKVPIIDQEAWLCKVDGIELPFQEFRVGEGYIYTDGSVLAPLLGEASGAGLSVVQLCAAGPRSIQLTCDRSVPHTAAFMEHLDIKVVA